MLQIAGSFFVIYFIPVNIYIIASKKTFNLVF